MASLRDIQRRIRSVTSTRQITHTMEMVSTTKIMKALQTAAQALAETAGQMQNSRAGLLQK